MKRLLKILGLTLLLILACLIIIPLIFEDELIQKLKDNVNESVEAKVDFGDFNLSLLRDFPDFTFAIEDITVTGVGQFDSLRLASIGQASFSLDIMSVIRGDKMRIKGIHIDRAYLNAIVLEDGTANYDILKESEDNQGDTVDVRDEYVILLEEYDITNSEIIYDNKSLGALIHIRGLDHRGDGSLTDKRYDLNTKTNVGEIDLVYEGIEYLQKAEAEIVANFDIQDDFRELNLNDNEIRINQLFLEAGGVVLLPEDGADLDLSYRSTKTELMNLLSLVPSEYMPDLDGLTTEGTIDLSGTIKGHYDDSSFPGFTLHTSIDDGRIQYPDLPEDINDLQIELDLSFPGGGTDFNSTVLNIPSFHLNIAESPITGNLLLRDMIEDPFIKTGVKAQVDLVRMKDAIAMEGVQDLSGIITVDIDLEGRLSAIEQEQYSKFKSAGQVILQSFDLAGDSIPVPVHITTAHLNFNPEALELASFKGNIGKSDISARGSIGNYLGYFLQDDLLSGDFEIQSKLLDLNEFLDDQGGETSQVEDRDESTELAASDSEGVISVPGNVDFSVNAKIDQLLYENLELNDIKGDVTIKDRVASLKNVRMKTLGGDVLMNGNYETKENKSPRFDFGFNLDGLNIPNTAAAFNTVSTLAPVAKQCQGEFSSVLNFSTDLDENMNPIYSSLTGGGEMTTAEVIVENFKPLLKIAEALKLDNWKKQSVDNVDLDFEFVDGKVFVKPFNLKLDGIESTIGGSMSFDQDLDYDVKMKVPMDKLGNQADQLLSGLIGQANSYGLNLSMGEFVNMNFKVTGKMDDPQIRPSILGQEGGTVKDVVKDIIEQEVQEIKEEAIEDVKAEAKEQADKILAEAQKQADALNAEAARASSKVREEGYKAAQQLEDEAKGLAKLAAKIGADKLRKESDSNAKKITDEAEKQAQSLMSNAQSKADALLQ